MRQDRHARTPGSGSLSAFFSLRALSRLFLFQPNGIFGHSASSPLKAGRQSRSPVHLFPALLAGILFSFMMFSCHQPPLEYAARFESASKEYRAFEAETSEIALKVTNLGTAVWKSEGPKPFFLSYHLLDNQGQLLEFDNARFPFPEEVRPGRSIEMAVPLKAPLDQGLYRLEFDCLQEGVTWFKDKGSKTLSLGLAVDQRDWPEREYGLGLEAGPYTKFEGGPPELAGLFKLIRITLKHDEAEFPGKTGTIKGFAAGSGYPQIWLRDSRTILPASRLFYSQDYLTSWLEEHLAFQNENGSLEDWVDPGGKTDKNTTETDQEASAVQAAGDVAQLLGPEWLNKKIGGRSILDRLESALSFVLKNRTDLKTGLILGAHTADWGDVDMEDADQQAVYTDSRTHWTADIYDQAMVYEACLDLAEMMEAAGRKEQARIWAGKASALGTKANAELWQEDKGFYRVHIHITPLTHDFNEDDMFAMGGNAQAVISGMAGERRAGRIIEQALKRQSDFALSTLSGSLLPPYPKGFFRHPSMDDPYEYQNGGQWDWFGGRLIRAMFEHGFSREARNKLLQIARKNLKNNGLFEWDAPAGRGRGSDYFAGSAGVLAGALLEGYFGVRLSRNGLSLEPRLGADSGAVHLNLPAAGLFAGYEYQYLEDQKKITLSFNSNSAGEGPVTILLPWERDGTAGGKPDFPRTIMVLRDGVPIAHELIRNRGDAFIRVRTDFRHRRLEIGGKD